MKTIKSSKQTSKLILSAVLMLFSALSFSQSLHQSIRGKVVDLDSKTPLVGVNLIVKDSNPMIGTITDEEGNFKFDKLPIGRHSIQAFYIGYEPGLMNNLLINAGKELVVTVELKESINQLEEIVVKSDKKKGEVINEMATVSARSFSVEETKRYAGSFNDPSRMAASYAGVTADPEGNNDIIIRGNTPRGLLWRLEGIEIPNPNHFANEGATGGPISILNSNMLRNSDFFTGAFPAEYGNAYSGVFDINLRKGNNENREYSFMAGIMGTDCSIEGPFVKGKKASYLLNYRYSTLAMLNAIGIKIVGDAVPEFQDIAFNINLPTEKAGTFSLFGIGGLSNIKEEDSTYLMDFKVNMGVLGLTHTYFIDNSTFLKSTLAVTGSDLIGSYYEPDEQDVMKEEYDENFLYTTSKASITLNKKINAKNTIKTGVIYSNLNFDLNSNEFDEQEGRMLSNISQSGNTDLIQAFASWKHRLGNNFTFNGGIHYMNFVLNNNTSIEPRLGLTWHALPNHTFSAGFGMHSKVESISTYFANTNLASDVMEYGNKNLGLTKSNHYVLGYQYRISPNLMLKTELYYQDLYDIPVSKDEVDGFSALNYSNGYSQRALINEGTGYNYGAEITLEKYFSDNYYFMLTSSLFESKYKGSDDILRNSRYNGNYVFNLLGGKEFKLKNNRSLSVSLRGTYAGGKRYTPIDLEESIAEQSTERDEDNYFGKQRDAFVRIDLKVRYRKNKGKTTRQWELDIQNVTNTLNITDDYFSTSTQSIETSTQMGLLPVLSYRIEF